MVSEILKEGLKFIEEIGRFCGYDKRLLVKSEADTDPNYGCLPFKRPIEEHIRHGIINLDKPPGPTSHEIVAWVKKMLDLSKAGHGGTLEPR